MDLLSLLGKLGCPDGQAIAIKLSKQVTQATTNLNKSLDSFNLHAVVDGPQVDI